MKKILIVTNLAFASVLYLQNCTNHKEVFVPDAGDNSKNWHCLNYSDSVFNGISQFTALNMYNTYGGNQYTKITTNNPANTDDAKCVWFSMDVIKKFIYKIEDTLHAKGFNPNTRLGIRFYFAAYPDSATMQTNSYLDKLPASYANRHTLFMVPTFDTVYGTQLTHQDFNAFEPLTPQRRIKAAIKLNEKNITTLGSVITTALALTNDVYIQNHGELGPPPSPVPGASF